VLEKDQIIIFKPDEVDASIEVQVHDETVWLNRNQLATLLDRDIKTIGKRSCIRLVAWFKHLI